MPEQTAKARLRSRRKLLLKGTLLAILVAEILLTLWWGFPGGTPVNRSTMAPAPPPFEYRGLIHCHTLYSDGGKPFEEVAAIAGRLGLDFLIITDHNTLRGREHEGMHGGCRVLVGNEISTDHGHLLAINTPETVYRLGGPGLETIREVRLLGGLSVIAHPISGYDLWHAPRMARPDGIEVYNGDSAWRNAPLWKVLFGFPAYLLNPERAFLSIMDDGQRERALWDRYLEDGPVYGFAGGDCHGRMPVGSLGIPFPRYERCLDAFQTHILTGEPLTGDFDADRRVIVDALRRGSSYLSLGPLGPASGFRFKAEPEDGGMPAVMGGSLGSGPARFVARVPAEREARLLLLRDGEVVAEASGQELQHRDERPGVYRVEVYADGPGTLGGRVPWIVSNPIRVGRPPAPDRVSELPACPEGRAFATFEDGDEGFSLEGDPVTLGASGQIERVTPGAAGTGTAAKFRFQIAPEGDNVYWAIVDRQPRSFPGARGISFHMRADRRIRVRLYLRDEDPVDREDKEWFTTTFMVGTDWRCIPIPFDELRCVSRGGDCRLDVNRVNGLFLVGDMDVLTYGSAGTVWLDEVSVFDAEPPAAGSSFSQSGR